MYELTIEQHFHAAHTIVGHPGKCARPHGHTYIVRVTIAGEQLDSLGMLVDFSYIRGEVSRILDELDHADLNELPAFGPGRNPTAEMIARYVFYALRDRLEFPGVAQPPTFRVARVEIQEGPGSVAAYYE